MKFKLNWKFKMTRLINHLKVYACLLIVSLSFNFNGKAQMSTIFLEEDTLTIYYGTLVFEQGTLFFDEDNVTYHQNGILEFANGLVKVDWQTVFQEDTAAFEGTTLYFGENYLDFDRGTLYFDEDSLVFESEPSIEKPDTTDIGDHSVLGTIDTIVAKTNKITIDDEELPVYSISIGRVGTVFPCGNRFGISLQAPGYHIFSAESAFNATYMPNGHDIDWPDDGPQKNVDENHSMTYKSSFNSCLLYTSPSPRDS